MLCGVGNVTRCMLTKVQHKFDKRDFHNNIIAKWFMYKEWHQKIYFLLFVCYLNVSLAMLIKFTIKFQLYWFGTYFPVKCFWKTSDQGEHTSNWNGQILSRKPEIHVLYEIEIWNNWRCKNHGKQRWKLERPRGR